MRQGFIATLESVIAATVLLIFLVNVLPNLTETDTGTDIIESRAIQILTSLGNSGELRPLLMDVNLTGLDSQIAPYLTGIETTIGVEYTNITGGTYTGGILIRNFSVNGSRVREQHLIVQARSASNLEIDVNGNPVLTTSSSGSYTLDIASDTKTGYNTLNISSDSAQLQYAVHIRNYAQHGALPSEGRIIAATYPIAGANTTFQPTELRVFLWR